jgi:Ion channel
MLSLLAWGNFGNLTFEPISSGWMAYKVGYGDFYPVTTAGKWVASLAMFAGILVMAFPISVFSE